nr:putative RNA polymerase sigma factor [Kibdelosporangium sp. MJ126-NF4]CTQ93473.1 putative RNA polymerase sigma factor [Kibdelosporangium sp. MJ126-NF4]
MPVRWLPELVQDGLEHGVIADERDRQLWRAFEALPERCQRLLRLFAYAPEFTYEQLADAIGLQVDSVGQTKTRCLRTLRSKLDSSLFDRIDPMPEVLARPSRHPVARFATHTAEGTRNAQPTLCFGSSRHAVHVEIGTALTGMVLPRADVQVWWPDGMISADVDRNGLFKADAPRGPVRLSVEGVVTDWFVR